MDDPVGDVLESFTNREMAWAAGELLAWFAPGEHESGDTCGKGCGVKGLIWVWDSVRMILCNIYGLKHIPQPHADVTHGADHLLRTNCCPCSAVAINCPLSLPATVWNSTRSLRRMVPAVLNLELA